MATKKMSAMSVDASLDGTERLLAQGADGSIVLVSGISSKVIDDLVGAAEITPTAGDAFLVERSGTEGTFAIADAEAWVVDTIEAVTLDTTIADADWIIFSDGGVLNRITLANLATDMTLPLASIDIDGGTDIGAALADADEIIVDDGGGGTNRRCDMSRVETYIVDKLEALTIEATPVDADHIIFSDNGTLKRTTVANLWDNRYLADMTAVADVSAFSWVIDEDTLTSDVDTKVPTQQSVKAYVDAQTAWLVHDLGALGVAPVANDLAVIADEDTADDPNKSVTVAEFLGAVHNLTALAAAPDVADMLLVTDEDVGGDPARSITVQNLFDATNALTAIGAAPATTDSVLLDDAGTAKKCTVANLFAPYFNDAATTEGAGITGHAATCEHSVTKVGGLYKTEIVIDLAGLESVNTDHDIIGDSGGGAAHIGQITAARNGTIFAGKITCLELPTTGDDEIDLYSATVGTGAYSDLVTDLTETKLFDSAGVAMVAGTTYPLIAYPATTEYLYLTSTDTTGTYATGILLIELWGK